MDIRYGKDPQHDPLRPRSSGGLLDRRETRFRTVDRQQNFHRFFHLFSRRMIAQRPPELVKRNARAAQKSLPGNVAHDRVGKNYETRSGKIRRAMRLGGFRLRVGDQPRGARGARGKENEGLLLPFFIPVIPVSPVVSQSLPYAAKLFPSIM